MRNDDIRFAVVFEANCLTAIRRKRNARKTLPPTSSSSSKRDRRFIINIFLLLCIVKLSLGMKKKSVCPRKKLYLRKVRNRSTLRAGMAIDRSIDRSCETHRHYRRIKGRSVISSARSARLPKVKERELDFLPPILTARRS